MSTAKLLLGLFIFWRSIRSLGRLIDEIDQDHINEQIARSTVRGIS